MNGISMWRERKVNFDKRIALHGLVRALGNE
jgi:hypothetical protein